MTTPTTYDVVNTPHGKPIKCWTRGVPFEEAAVEQLRHVAELPFIFHWVAAMPDVHAGKGATVGSVVATKGAVIPSAVGVDIGCGMMAVETSLRASDLPGGLREVREAIEARVPHGRTDNGGANDRGAWHDLPANVAAAWETLRLEYDELTSRHPRIGRGAAPTHLGTLGTGNHFIEVCIDEREKVWIMLHSGSRGVGNRIGTHFIEAAMKEMKRWFVRLPDDDLAYLPEGTDLFRDYLQAAGWAQRYAALNRELMMAAVVEAIRSVPGIRELHPEGMTVNCHHNYVAREKHLGDNVLVTRKGAVRAQEGDAGIIPGSMGARSYIVRGLGNPESFHSCSHGAGRAMSRNAARRAFTLEDHARATEGVECRKDADVIDETPAAYKSIAAVMEAQKDLVEIVHTLKQLVCVKG